MRPRIAIPVAHSTDLKFVARAMPQYEHAVREAGGDPVPIPLGGSNAEIARLASLCAGVLLPGSKADVNPEKYDSERSPHTADPDPLRDNVDELLLQDAYNMHKPILGICFGNQILNVWRTGSLVQHIREQISGSLDHDSRECRHTVAIEPSSLLAEITGEFVERKAGQLRLEVNSSHHQAIGRVGDGLRVVATCTADGVIEAVESTATEHFVLGVQWHPERTYERDPASRAIFRAFIYAALERLERPRTPTLDFESLHS